MVMNQGIQESIFPPLQNNLGFQGQFSEGNVPPNPQMEVSPNGWTRRRRRMRRNDPSFNRFEVYSDENESDNLYNHRRNQQLAGNGLRYPPPLRPSRPNSFPITPRMVNYQFQARNQPPLHPHQMVRRPFLPRPQRGGFEYDQISPFSVTPVSSPNFRGVVTPYSEVTFPNRNIFPSQVWEHNRSRGPRFQNCECLMLLKFL